MIASFLASLFLASVSVWTSFLQFEIVCLFAWWSTWLCDWQCASQTVSLRLQDAHGDDDQLVVASSAHEGGGALVPVDASAPPAEPSRTV